MTGCRRTLSFVAPFLVAVLVSRAASAQDTTLAQDTLLLDTVPPRPTAVAIKAPETPDGPLPPGSRYVFTRDSLVWSGAWTLSDLMGDIPGVYIARAGFLGLPEYVAYAGRGADAVELYWDGLRMEPVGTDTLFADLTRIPLALLRRVEIEVLPTSLRVYLVSERHERLAPRSVIGVGSGRFSTAAFTGMFQHRWASGFEITTAADFLSTNGVGNPNRSDQGFDIFAKFGWIPRPNLGAEYQIRRQDHDRDPLTTDAGVLGVPERRGSRTDVLFTMFAGTRADGLGLRVEGGLGISAWDPDSGSVVSDQRVRRAYLETGHRGATWNVSVRGTVGDARTLGSVEGRVGWVPLSGIVLSGDGRWARHDGDRTSSRFHGAAGIYYGPLSLVGEVSIAEAVQAPALLADPVQRTVDRAVKLALNTPRLAGHVRVVQRDAYAPLAFPDLPAATFDPAVETTVLTAALELRPFTPLTISGWYADAVDGALADFEPPQHWRGAVTFRSKFWPTFRSGTFDLKLEIALESWGAGIAGRDANGISMVLPAATLQQLLLEFQLGGFTGFWQMRNAGNQTTQYVPGFPYPLSAQTFGVKWVFAN